MSFRPEYSQCIGFRTLPIFGNFRKRYHTSAGYWQDTIVVRSAEQWLDQFSTDSLKCQVIAELFRQICLRAFRRDIYAAIQKDISPPLKARALRGHYPLTFDTLQRVLDPQAAGITIPVSRNQGIRDYPRLFEILWGDNPDISRGPWAHTAGYRLLYQICREALSSRVGRPYADQWHLDLRAGFSTSQADLGAWLDLA